MPRPGPVKALQMGRYGKHAWMMWTTNRNCGGDVDPPVEGVSDDALVRPTMTETLLLSR